MYCFNRELPLVKKEDNKRIVLVLFYFLVITFFILFIYSAIPGKRDIAITTNPKGYDQFDMYLKDEIGIENVPTHLVIKNNEVSAKVEGLQGPEEMTDLLEKNNCHYRLWESPIKKMNGKETHMQEYDYIIVKKAGCSVCKDQEDEEELFKTMHPQLNILTYYIRTDKKDL